MRLRALIVALGVLAAGCGLFVALTSGWSTLSREEGSTELLTVGGVYLGSFGELGVGEAAPDFPEGDDVEWLNTLGSNPPKYLRGEPLSIRALRRQGKVVVLHFWDYTSMLSAMAIPALRRWHERYSPFDVELIGVHKARFSFASRLVHVADAVQRLGIKYPVVNDAHGDIATAYGSNSIPNMFIIGTDGRITAVSAGLDNMEDMEYEICLAAAEKYPNMWCGPDGLKGKDVTALRAAKGQSLWQDEWMQWIAWRIHRYECMQKTQDMILGAKSKHSALTHLQRYSTAPTLYTDLAGVPLGEGKFVLSGHWVAQDQGVTVLAGQKSGMVNTHVRLRYHAKGVYALMGLEGTEHTPEHMCADGTNGPAPAGNHCIHMHESGECRDVAGERGLHGWCETAGGSWGGCSSCQHVDPVSVYVLLDGQPIEATLRGKDIEEDAFGRTLVTVREPRLYALIGGVMSHSHSLSLLPAAPGLSLHQFSFTSECSQDAPRSLHSAPPASKP